MPKIDIEGPLNFRDLVADIADTTVDDITILEPVPFSSFEAADLMAEVTLDNGYVMTFESWRETSEEFTFMSIANPSSVDTELPTVIVLNDVALELSDLRDIQSYFDGTIYGLDEFGFNTLWILSTSNDAVVAGFDNRAVHWGVGTIKGRGGDDTITLTAEGLFAQPESHGRALGGYGDDYLQVLVDNAFVAGGAGDDYLFFLTGRTTAKGGPGEDTFVFMSSESDAYPDPSNGSDDAPVRAHIRDFDPSNDSLSFDFSTGQGAVGEQRSLAEMFGDGDLSTLQDFTFDGLRFTFHENAKGTSIITRSGTDSNGMVYDETVVLRATGLDEINRDDVVLYADEGLFLGA